MKKMILSGLVLSMLASAGSVFADEYDITSSEPSLIYNNLKIGAEGSMPFITEGRTMLPFRYLLEEIGATVDYDEAARTVKAEKSGIEIAFSLDDKYIDVTKDGATERVVSDVANVIKEDRVYVPIRFMSEAFDLNVGWDDYERTAIIIDIPKYVAELEENAPEFKRYMEIVSSLNMPDNYTQTLDMTVDFSAGFEDENINLKLGLDSELSLNKGAVEADAAVDLDTNLIKELAGVDIQSLKDVKFTFKYNDGQFYVNTNLIDKLKEIAPNNEDLKNISALVNSDSWFKADIHELFAALGLPDQLIDAVKMGLSGKVSEDYFGDVLAATVATDLNSVMQAQSIDMAFDMYASMFGDSMTITENGEGNYDIKINITKDAVKKLIEDVISPVALSDDSMEALNAVMDAFVFDCTIQTKIENNVETTSDMKFVMNLDYEGVKLNFDMTGNSLFTPDTNKEIVMPESAINLIDLINLFK